MSAEESTADYVPARYYLLAEHVTTDGHGAPILGMGERYFGCEIRGRPYLCLFTKPHFAENFMRETGCAATIMPLTPEQTIDVLQDVRNGGHFGHVAFDPGIGRPLKSKILYRFIMGLARSATAQLDSCDRST